MDRVTACQRFKYFVVDNSILLALLEEPLGNDQGLYFCPSWYNAMTYFLFISQISLVFVTKFICTSH